MNIKKQNTEVEFNLEPTLGSEERIGNNLLDNHIFVLSGEIENDLIERCLRWIIHENNCESDDKILTLYVNSIGGNLSDAFALIDMMRHSKYPIRTIGIGSVMSSGFMIFASGTKGQRYIGKNASILCHQYSDEMEAKHHDLKAQIIEGERMNGRMICLLEEQTNLSKKTIKSKLLKETDVWLSSEQMLEFGIADHIL